MYRLLYQGMGEYPNRVYEFVSEDMAMAWKASMLRIKRDIAAINPAGHCDHLYLRWLEHVYKFCRAYGAAYVPLDIHDGTNSVERALGVATTQWE